MTTTDADAIDAAVQSGCEHVAREQFGDAAVDAYFEARGWDVAANRAPAILTGHAELTDAELADALDRNGYYAGAERLRAGEDRTAALRAEYADDADARYDDAEGRALAAYVREVVAG